MKINLRSRINWESKVDHAMRVVDVSSLAQINYGPGLSQLNVTLICSGAKLGHKQRVRLAHASMTLSMDVILDLNYFVNASHVERRWTLYEQILGDIRQVFEKRRIKDFDFERFLGDLGCLLNEQLTGQNSDRFDKFCLERATGF